MGGLAGIVHFDGAPPDPADAEAIAELQARRGPDGSGRFTEGPATFAHRLRRLLPESPSGVGKVQPAVADDLVVMLDGWLYEHEALLKELGQDPAQTDTETLLL